MTWKAARKGADFKPMFPSPSGPGHDAGVVPNNARPGKWQPDARPSPRRKHKCTQCGFPADLSRHASDGGSLEGSGAGGDFTTHSSDSKVKEQNYRNGAGCPHCFAKNNGGKKGRVSY
jgi:hypothetical protein